MALVEPELERRLRSADVAYEPLHVLEGTSGDSHGVDEPELVDECGRMVVKAAMVKRIDLQCGQGTEEWRARLMRFDVENSSTQARIREVSLLSGGD